MDLELTEKERERIIDQLRYEDYIEGPFPDKLYGSPRQASMWVFGKVVKEKNVYIKITMGITNNPVLCISFHVAEHPLNFPFKK